jgi:hypothetical protein
MMPDDRPDRRRERRDRVRLRRLGKSLSTLARHPLVLAVVFAIAVANADKIVKVGGFERWALVAVIGVLIAASLLVLWRSRTRQRLLDFERQIGALTEQLAVAEQLNHVNKEQADLAEAERDADRSELAIAARARTYADLQSDVAEGLAEALKSKDSINVVKFVERNCLRPINETFAGELGDGARDVKIETGIAIRTREGLRVTHGSGSVTLELKEEGGCRTGAKPIEQLLTLKAAAYFRGGGWQAVPLAETEPLQYLFILSTEQLGPAERHALEQHAKLIKLAAASLVLTAIEG